MNPPTSSARISVVVPCFNEEEVLPQLFQRLGDAAQNWNLEYEIICVDDGSHDRTCEMLLRQHQSDPRWKALSFARNFGHQVAVSAGLYHATGDAVLIIDADLQDPPEQIHRLIGKWREGYQVVYAVRKARHDARLKQVLAWLFYRVIAGLVPFNVPTDSGDYGFG
jgi:polyisoprenyl-phosphate glycosyltransferase